MIVGNGQFYNTDAIGLMQRLSDGCIDLIATDPPYRTISGGNAPTDLNGFRQSVLERNDGKIFNHNNVSIVSYMQQFVRILKPGTHCYVMTNALNLREMLNIAQQVGFHLHNLLIWERNNANANRWYMKHVEYVLFLYKKPAKPINDCGSKQIFRCNNPRNKRHPTEKPVELMEHYVLNSSNPGDVVLDPFAGSGSTLVAAQQNNRRWIGCEIDPIFYYPTFARMMSA